MMINQALEDRQAVLGPGGPAPVRRLNSVRRTLSIDTVFPDGLNGPQDMLARCRDIRTGATLDDIEELDFDEVQILASRGRKILDASSPKHSADELSRLIGLRAGGQLRGANADLNPDMKTGGSAFHLILDDLAVATLTAGWVWTEWIGEKVDGGQPVDMDNKPRHQMENACVGFVTGSSSLRADGSAREDNQHHRRVPSLVHPDDPDGWHEMTDQTGVASRRARWIDIWKEDEEFCLEAGFQDSGTLPDGTRGAVHEYVVKARADAQSMTLSEIRAEPRILPYIECPAAVARVQMLVGSEISQLRFDVVQYMKGTNGCTHLNDVLRGMADVSWLVRSL